MPPSAMLAYRERHHLTQGELADLLGVCRLQIWRYEKGRAPIPMPAQLLMRALESGPALNKSADRNRIPPRYRGPHAAAYARSS